MTAAATTSPRTIYRPADDSITSLVHQGAVHAVRKWIETRANELEIQPEAFQELGTRVTENSDKLTARLSRDIKETLDDNGQIIEYSNRAPVVTIGCIRFNEKERGLWEMSILDNHVIRKVETSCGRVLAGEAIREIKGLQRELRLSNRHLSNLQKAIDYLKTFCNPIPVNLLMVVAGQAGSLRSNLSSHVPSGNSQGMSRALVGILLWRMFQDSRSGSPDGNGSLRPVGATQYHTRDTWQYLTLPTNPDPEKLCESKPIHAIHIN